MSARQGEKAFSTTAAAPEDSGFGPVPTPEDLALIHRYTLRPMEPDELYVRRMVLANDAVDRSYERFTPEVLNRFAETLPGKSLLVAHDKGRPAQGLFYQAQVRKAAPGESGGHSLVASFYMVKSPANADARQQIDGGVMRHVSIGFRYDQRLCDICGREYYDCPHFPGDTIEDAGGTPRTVTSHYGGDLSRYEANEGSLVYLGCQRDATIVKHEHEHEEGRMENEKALARIKELEAELAAVQARVVSIPKLEEERDRLKAERDSFHEQLRSAQALAGHVLPSEEERALGEDGKAYREHLRAEVKRLAGIVKSEAEANLLLSALPNAPAKALKELVDSYQARVEEKFPPSGRGELHAPAAAAADPEPKAPGRPVQF
jgi:hypothetical protein